jgi:hypothetical protein
MISKRSRYRLTLSTLAAAGLAGLLGLVGCSKSADSKGNAQPQAAVKDPGAAATGADEMAPTAVAPDPGNDPAAAPGDPATAPDPGEKAAAGDKGTAGKAAPAAAGLGSTGAETEYYKVAITYPPLVKAGGSGVATIVITPAAGWKMNHEFPTKITVAAPSDVSLTNAEQKREDAASFADKGASFVVPFTASSAGDKAFQAKLKFAVCTDATCDPKKEELAWNVAVE